MSWRTDMENAPKMKTILLFAVVDTETGNWKMAAGFWHTSYEGRETTTPWCWDGHQVRSYETQPTHWMPLPEPPQ